jgi:glycosyltransferase involved in cell wall biosynthesis
MNVALCLEFPIDQFGGTEVLVRELILGLSDRHEVTLVSPDDPQTVSQSSIGTRLKRHITWKPEEISAAKSQELARKLGDAQVQLAHFHFGGNYGWGNRYFAKSPVLAVDRAGIPCVSTNHGAFSILDGYCGPQKKVLRWVLLPSAWINKQHVLAHVRVEVAVSQNDFRSLRCWYPLMRRKFGQIYHSRIHGAPPRTTGRREETIICVGTIGLRKGQTYLVEAFARVAKEFPAWNLVLVGRPSEMSMLEQIRAAMARDGTTDRVRLVNECTNEEVANWLRRAAIFAMPSLAEGLGLSLQEAMFSGCACIASDAGGMRDLIQHGVNGILAGAGNVADLAGGLRKLMADEPLRLRLGERAAASIVERGMLAETMVKNYERLYEGVLSGAKTGALPQANGAI